MASVASLSLFVSGDAKRLAAELRRSRGRVRLYSRQVRQEFGRLASAGAKSLTVLAGGFTAATVKIINSSEQVAKAARNAGLAADQFQLLAHAFTLAGADSNVLVKASQTLSKQIFELGRGLVTYQDYFDQLGLSYADLAELSPAEALRLVIERLRGVQDESDQTAVALNLLGRGGKNLGTIMAQTNTEFNAVQERLAALNGVISGQALANAEALRDEYDVFATVLRARFANAVLTVTPSMEQMNHIINQVGGAVENATKAILSLTRFLAENLDTIGTLLKVYIAWRVATSKLAVSLVRLTVATAKSTASAIAMGKGFTAASRSIGLTAAAVRGLRSALGIGVVLGAIELITAALFKWRDANEAVSESIAGIPIATQIAQAEQSLISLRNRQREIREEVEKLNDATASIGSGNNASIGAEFQLNTEYSNVTREIESLEQRVESLRQRQVEKAETTKTLSEVVVEASSAVTESANTTNTVIQSTSDRLAELREQQKFFIENITQLRSLTQTSQVTSEIQRQTAQLDSVNKQVGAIARSARGRIFELRSEQERIETTQTESYREAVGSLVEAEEMRLDLLKQIREEQHAAIEERARGNREYATALREQQAVLLENLRVLRELTPTAQVRTEIENQTQLLRQTSTQLSNVPGAQTRRPGGRRQAAIEAARQQILDRNIEAIDVEQFTTLGMSISENLKTGLAGALRTGNFDNLGELFLNSLTSAFTGLDGGIGDVFDQLAGHISDAIGSLFDSVSSSVSGSGGGGLFGGGGFLSGLFSIFHEGGKVPGRRGEEVPAILEAGELVLTERQQMNLSYILNTRESVADIVNRSNNVVSDANVSTSSVLRESLLASARANASEITASSEQYSVAEIIRESASATSQLSTDARIALSEVSDAEKIKTENALNIVRQDISGIERIFESARVSVSSAEMFETLRGGELVLTEDHRSEIENIGRTFATEVSRAVSDTNSISSENLTRVRNEFARTSMSSIMTAGDNAGDYQSALSVGNAVSLDELPRFQDGGFVPGRMGEEIPAIVHGGELILNPDQQADIGGETNVNVSYNITGSVDAAVRRFFSQNSEEVAGLVTAVQRERRII